MGKRIVIALGGNALGKTISEQAEVVKGSRTGSGRSSGCNFTWKWTTGRNDPEGNDCFA